MKNFIVYNNIGEILRTGTCPDSMISIQAGVGEVAIEGVASDLMQRINPINLGVIDKVICPCTINKTTMSADGVDLCAINNLPIPSLIEIEGGGRWKITDGSFEFTIDTPGKYNIACRSPLYLEVRYTINAN